MISGVFVFCTYSCEYSSLTERVDGEGGRGGFPLKEALSLFAQTLSIFAHSGKTVYTLNGEREGDGVVLVVVLAILAPHRSQSVSGIVLNTARRDSSSESELVVVGGGDGLLLS